MPWKAPLHLFKSSVLYCPSKGHTFSFWPCYIRSAQLIIDKFLVEFSLLLYYCIYLQELQIDLSIKDFSSNFACFFLLIIDIRSVYKFPCLLFSGVTWNCSKFLLIYFCYYISFHFIHFKSFCNYWWTFLIYNRSHIKICRLLH